MGTNESKYAWMDEGWASFTDFLICSDLDAPEKASIYYLDNYKRNADREVDVPIISNSKFLKRPVYHYNAYAKPAAFFLILHDLLGHDLFKQATHEYMSRWNSKHPTPYDFFFTFNEKTCNKTRIES